MGTKESRRPQAQGTRRDARRRDRPARRGAILPAIILAVLVAVAPVHAGAQGAGQGDLGPLLIEQPYPYEAKDVALTDMLHELSHKTGLPVVVGAGVSGRADIANVGGSVRSLLDGLADAGRVSWWFDGAAVHVEPAEMTSRLLPLNGVRAEDLRAALRAVGMTAGEYPMIAEPGARLIRIVAPQGYVDMVEQTIAALAAEAKSKGTAALPVIIRGPGRARQMPLRSPGWAAAPYAAAPYAAGRAPAQAAAVPPHPSDPFMEQR